MDIYVRYAGLARNKVGKSAETLKIGPGSTLRDLMTVLETAYGEAIGNPERYIVVHNHKGCLRQEWPDRLLQEGDEVLLISNIAGG